MSIAVLGQVYDETRRLAVAGSGLAAGDFRLKKLSPPLSAAAAKVPVFGKVADAIGKLVDGPPEESAPALLELSTLVSAVLYTQGETGVEGPLEPIPTSDFGLPSTQTSARLLKPLFESLTTTGSGREEIIKDAHARGAFRDLRLVRVTLAALDDPYGPIADFVADEVLPLYGLAIYDELREAFDPKGKGGQVRRLRLLHRLDAARTHELVDRALESGSADMKVAAIACLEGRAESLSYLLEQTKAKGSEVRRAALTALAALPADEAASALVAALSSNDLELAAEPASRNRHPKVLGHLLDETEKQLAALLATKDKAAAEKAAQRFSQLLRCFASRDDKQSIAFLTRCFERRAEIGRVKADPGGEQLNRQVVALLVRSRNKPAQKLVADAHATLSVESLDWAMVAAASTRKPAEVFELFSPYYSAKPDTKKRRTDPASLRYEAVRVLLDALAGFPDRGWGHFDADVGWDEDHDLYELRERAELDPRWLDAAISIDDLQMVVILARPKHKRVAEYLSRTLEEMLAKKGNFDYHVEDILETMLEIEHPRTVDHFIASLERIGRDARQHPVYWLSQLIPRLPKSAAPRIEALLPKLPEKVADEVAAALSELQMKA